MTVPTCFCHLCFSTLSENLSYLAVHFPADFSALCFECVTLASKLTQSADWLTLQVNKLRTHRKPVVGVDTTLSSHFCILPLANTDKTHKKRVFQAVLKDL